VCRDLPGTPTVRGAEFLGGNRMPNKRMPVVERRQETHGDMLGPSVERRRDNWPDTSPGGWARKSADVGR
jgi:hypothetical protein